ncbi:SIMPL domain-containing protein [Luedemannella flava]|uniref:SIMPL domain-containing protein n=1 Tax=Luedemannella flava TaxID=349316 RepID=UPI0031DB779A
MLVVLAALAVLSPGPLGTRPAFASATATVDPAPAGEPRDSVLVDGTGEVYGTPDTLTAELGVETTAATVGEAMDRASVAATRMRDALLRAGIARADIQTSSVSVAPKEDEDQRIIGYTASVGLTVKIRDLRRAGAILSAAIAAGGNAARLDGVSYAIDNDAALLATARRKAFADARRKAELYAREAGRRLGRVLKVSETAASCGECDGGRGAFAGGGSAAPIEPGRQRLTVTVTVEWALDPSPRRAD